MRITHIVLATVPWFLFTSIASAETIRLPRRVVQACIGKRTEVVQSRVQCNQIVINGRTSRRTTFSVNGQILRLRADIDEANLVARCREPGRETFAVEMEINNPNRTRYVFDLTVKCEYCEEEG